jgi:hypothetical protein
MGDADGDGDVDGRDFLVWQRQVAASAPEFASVPEPATLSLFLFTALVFGRISRRGSSVMRIV